MIRYSRLHPILASPTSEPQQVQHISISEEKKTAGISKVKVGVACSGEDFSQRQENVLICETLKMNSTTDNLS